MSTDFSLPGLGIGIIAPSGALPEPEALDRAQARLMAAGAQLKVSAQACTQYQRFAGDDLVRLSALHEYLDDPAVQLILAARGGYGLTRLLPQIDFARLAASGKWLAGHSDFNTLQLALLAQTGAPSLVGPMACYDFGALETNADCLRWFAQALGRQTVQVQWQTTAERISAEGTLWGGNLSVLVSLLGTPYFPQIERGILFLEDINEHPYRIERMLLQLQHAGVLDRQHAILLGDFSSYRLTEYDAGYDLPTAFAAVAQRCSAPLVSGLPFGHCARKASLPMGPAATLEVRDQNATLTFAGLDLLPA